MRWRVHGFSTQSVILNTSPIKSCCHDIDKISIVSCSKNGINSYCKKTEETQGENVNQHLLKRHQLVKHSRFDENLENSVDQAVDASIVFDLVPLQVGCRGC